MANELTLYQGNTTGITCEISSSISLAGFSTYLQVRKEKDGTVYCEDTGSLVLYSGSYTGAYDLTAEETSIAAGHYFYEVTVESGSDQYTVKQDDFVVKNSIKY